MRLFIFCVLALAAFAQPRHGVKPARFVIKNVTIVEGNGTPAQGPVDIVIEDGVIASVGRSQSQPNDVVLEARGKYVLPGLVNMHGHLHDERGGVPMDFNYVLRLWLACGITTVRDVGSPLTKTLQTREKSAKGEIAAPRLFVYPFLGRVRNADAARRRVREIKAAGADGLKIVGAWRDTLAATAEEAKTLGLPVAIHIGVEEANANHAIAAEVRTIEHWYGIPDAALKEGVQNFPSNYNYLNEADRFRYAGRLWREADPKLLAGVLDRMVAAKVAWNPTLEIYEASRDLQRAQTQPQFGDYLHPVLADFFRPNLENHGSYFVNWSSTDETFWKENYQHWFRAVRDFASRGGLVTLGDDAGYIYQMYGYGMIRNLELHQEAGFHPVKIIEQATLNGARALGQESKIGRVRAGWSADLVIVNGNPLEDLKTLYPGRGIEWTIKAGIPYSNSELMREVKAIVDNARNKK
jgi:imidazolonepropionase-like amidohydrolase